MPIAAIFVICACVTLVMYFVVIPWVLKKRGVTVVPRTKFGVALIFDSADDDGTPVRLLNVGGTFQSAAYLGEGLRDELVCEYHRNMVGALRKLPRGARVLVIGGGGYSLPRFILTHSRQMRVDVVEIDPAITDIAREYFGLDGLEERFGEAGDGRLRLVCADGWEWLRSGDETYDAIVNDAFSGKRPLGPIATDEGAHVVRGHLAEGGFYLANVRSSLEGKRAANLEEARSAFEAVFAHVYVFAEKPEEPLELGYNAFVACDSEL